MTMRRGESSNGSPDRDGAPLTLHWWAYPEAGAHAGNIAIDNADQPKVMFQAPDDAVGTEIHLVPEVSGQWKADRHGRHFAVSSSPCQRAICSCNGIARSYRALARMLFTGGVLDRRRCGHRS